ncbi:MAG: universal stress protein [Nakamurella sp.]
MNMRILGTIPGARTHGSTVDSNGQLRQPGTRPYRRVIVGVDGSPASIDALRWAARQAALTGSTLEAITSWVMPGTSGLEFGAGECDWADNARSALATAVQEAFDGTVPVNRRVIPGRAQDVLVDAAEHADLLVVGSRGHGALIGMLTGSVSEHVVAHSPCPVVVVRHIPDPRHAAGHSRRAGFAPAAP